MLKIIIALEIAILGVLYLDYRQTTDQMAQLELLDRRTSGMSYYLQTVIEKCIDFSVVE